MYKIYEEEILNEYEACVYCGTAVGSDFQYRGCCGEVHSEKCFDIGHSHGYMESETLVLLGRKPLTDDEQQQLVNDHKTDLYRGK